jgi:uncharacterized protein (TIGR00297 family)
MIAHISAAAVLNILFASIAYIRRRVSISGAAAGFLVGFGLYIFSGLGGWLLLGFFFFSSTLIGILSKEKQSDLERIHQRGTKRDYIQVAANGLPPLVFAAVFYITDQMFWYAAFAASLASAASDTWASEGGILSPEPPVDFFTRRRVKPGLSGGVTLWGTLFASAGAAVMGLFSAAILYIIKAPDVTFDLTLFLTTLMTGLIVGVMGFAGSLIDTMLGAGLQAKYHDGTRITERPGPKENRNPLVSGISWVNNDLVNFVSVSLAGGAAALIHWLIL